MTNIVNLSECDNSSWPILLTLANVVILSTSNRIPTSKNGSHVYFLLQVFWVLLLFDINVVLILQWWPDFTIVQTNVTIVVLWQLLTGSIHEYLFATAPLWIFYLRYWEFMMMNTVNLSECGNSIWSILLTLANVIIHDHHDQYYID